MDDVMKKDLLVVCEKYAIQNVDVNVDFVYELIQTAIKNSETKIDDLTLSAILATKPIVKNLLKDLVDKINGET